LRLKLLHNIKQLFISSTALLKLCLLLQQLLHHRLSLLGLLNCSRSFLLGSFHLFLHLGHPGFCLNNSSPLFFRLRSCLLNLNLKTAKHRRTGAWFRGRWGTVCHLLSEQQQLVAGGEQLLVHLCQPADERGLPGAAVHAGVDEVDEEEGEGHDHQQGDPVPVETSGAMCCFVEPAWHIVVHHLMCWIAFHSLVSPEGFLMFTVCHGIYGLIRVGIFHRRSTLSCLLP